MPVLIAAGAKDLFMNIEKTMELVHGIPQAEFYLAPEGGHVHQWEYPEPYDSVVVGIFDETYKLKKYISALKIQTMN